tara:strand:- start:1009 stop:1812 length:804 start_codon:yes stop_codon:yes gene_type:complete
LRNWAEAQLRSARYRAANAARLGASVAAGLLILFIAALALFGQLDDVTDAAGEAAQARMAALGFRIEAVDITGADGALAGEAAAASGAFDGQPIFAFNPSQSRTAVEALPWVRQARVARLWPNRIAVIVEPRTEFAVWQYEGAINLIDRDGVVLREVDAGDYPDLPLVVDRGAEVAATELLDTLARYPAIAERVVAAVRVGERRWNLRLDTGMDIKLPEEESGAALALLAAMHAERGVLRLDAESIDLREPGEMILRERADRAEREA